MEHAHLVFAFCSVYAPIRYFKACRQGTASLVRTWKFASILFSENGCICSNGIFVTGSRVKCYPRRQPKASWLPMTQMRKLLPKRILGCSYFVILSLEMMATCRCILSTSNIRSEAFVSTLRKVVNSNRMSSRVCSTSLLYTRSCMQQHLRERKQFQFYTDFSRDTGFSCCLKF